MSLDVAACAPLRTHWRALVATAADKRSFFEHVRELTALTANFSGIRRFGAQGLPELGPADLRIAFLGDSVTREVAFAWHALVPTSTTVSSRRRAHALSLLTRPMRVHCMVFPSATVRRC